MKAVFADTFYWAALTNPDDAAHERAMVLSRSLAPDKIITTDEVFCEYLAFLCWCAPERPGRGWPNRRRRDRRHGGAGCSTEPGVLPLLR